MQDLKALEGKSLAELREIAKALGIKNVMIKKRELIEKIAGTDTPEEAPAENEAGAKGEVSETAAKPAQEAAPQTAAPKAKAPRGRRPRLAKNENAAPQPEAAAEPEPEPKEEGLPGEEYGYEGYELDEIWEDEDEYIEDDETESER